MGNKTPDFMNQIYGTIPPRPLEKTRLYANDGWFSVYQFTELTHQYVLFETIVGETLLAVEVDKYYIIFYTASQDYICRHDQDCCENVYLEDVVGDIQDIIGHPILKAQEVVQSVEPQGSYQESATATFYHISTIKGTVSLIWRGESNGFYSEKVSTSILSYTT